MADTETTTDSNPSAVAAERTHDAWWRHPFILVPWIFYYVTSAPTIGLGDTAMLIDGIQTLHISTHCNSHNVTVLIGWLLSFLPFENIAFKANLLSVVVGSSTVVAFYFLVRAMFQNVWVAAISASCLMVSHSMWWHSTLTEVYAVNAAFMVTALWLVWRLHEQFEPRRLYALFFVAGLSIFNHAQLGTIALGATIILIGKAVSKDGGGVKLFLGSSTAFLIGFLPYLITFLADTNRVGFATAFDEARGSHFKTMMFSGRVWTSVQDLGFLIFQQFPTPFLLAVIVGVALFYKTWKVSLPAAALTVTFGVNTVFFMFFQTWDKFAFLLPSFVILVFWGAFAIAPLVRWASQPGRMAAAFGLAIVNLGCLVFPIYFYGKLSEWGQSPGFWQDRYNNAFTSNTHDAASYIANPNKRGYYEIEDLANQLFERLPSDAIFIDDDSRTYYSIKYFQRYYERRDDISVQLINSWGFKNWGASAKQFGDGLENALQQNQPLFMVSIDWPFQRFLKQVGKRKRYRFQRFRLSEERWIYQLVPLSKTEDQLTDYERLPHCQNMITGRGLNGPDGERQSEFGSKQQVMTYINFVRNDHSFPVVFEWWPPGASKPYEVSKPFMVRTGSTNLWSKLRGKQPRAAGEWTVRAMSGKHRLIETRFTMIKRQ